MKTLIAITMLAGATLSAQTAKTDPMNDCPMHAQHQSMAARNPELNQRGDEGMGFSQEKTTHHFLLRADGGVIQVSANSADDKTSVDQIRQHLQHISSAFQAGDFNIPMFVHDQTPPGVPVMQELKGAISYRFEQSEGGAQVVISTADKRALEAIHEFLRFQIREHRTGDPLEIR